MKSIVNRLEDLRLSSHKVEVDRLISEQEWKIKQSKHDYHLSFLSYVVMVVTSLVLMILCYCCCCKCCKRRFPGFSKWWKDNNPCTTIIIKPKIINSLHSSRESLRTSNARSLTRKPSLGDMTEETELVSLKTGVKQHHLANGKALSAYSTYSITLSTMRSCNSLYIYIVVYYIKAIKAMLYPP